MTAMTHGTPASAGRRSQNKREKRDRIVAAARHLFAENGYEAVATQQVSEAAGIGVGTLFRYAATKGELLLMVYNDEFAEAIDRGRVAAARAHGTEEAVWELARALVDGIAADPHTVAMYQRELLFGGAGEGHRDEGLMLVAAWQHAVAQHLARSVGVADDDERVVLAARTAFAALSLIASDVRRDARTPHQLRLQIAQIVAGLSAQVAHGE